MFDLDDLRTLARLAIAGLLLAAGVLWIALVLRLAWGVLTWA